MADTMQAAVFHAPHDLRLEEVPVPQDVGPDEVLLKVDRTAICGTDLHPYEGHMEAFADREVTKVVLDPSR
jgi:threonine dehydrogenase-like Zn-dependent dehydrogenase